MLLEDYQYGNVSELLKYIVWQKGRVIPNEDPNEYLQDACGKTIKYSEYGMDTFYGWEIDHIIPVALGGSEHIGNLQPLYWRNNRQKGDIYPWSFLDGISD